MFSLHKTICNYAKTVYRKRSARGFEFLLFKKKISFIKKSSKGKEFRISNQIIELIRKIEEVSYCTIR